MVVNSKPMSVPMAAFPSMPIWIPGAGYGYGYGVPPPAGSPPMSYYSSSSTEGPSSPPPLPQFWHSIQFYNPGFGGADGFQPQGGGIASSPPPPMTNYGFPAIQFQGYVTPMGSPPAPTYGYDGSYSYFPNNMTSGDGQAPQGFQDPNFNNPGNQAYVYMVSSPGLMYGMASTTSEVTSEVFTNSGAGEAAATFDEPGMKPPRKARAPKPKKPKKLCTFCVQNKETDSFCQSHTLKNPDFTICCPILRKYVCPLCKATGDDAHTVKYCPKNEGQAEVNFKSHGRANGKGVKNVQIQKPRPKRNARGVVGSYHYEKI